MPAGLLPDTWRCSQRGWSSPLSGPETPGPAALRWDPAPRRPTPHSGHEAAGLPQAAASAAGPAGKCSRRQGASETGRLRTLPRSRWRSRGHPPTVQTWVARVPGVLTQPQPGAFRSDPSFSLLTSQKPAPHVPWPSQEWGGAVWAVGTAQSPGGAAIPVPSCSVRGRGLGRTVLKPEASEPR